SVAPWHPESPRCSRCGTVVSGERYDRYAARYQHLRLSDRIAHLATAGVLAGEEKLVDGAGALLRDYSSKYFEFPNRDNVLGPTRLFFSTYLESIWLCNAVAAGHLLREGGALDDATAEAVGSIAEEAANLIGEFDEGLSNRQTWNNAALVASAVWFEDEDLARRGIEGRTGLIGHLVDGVGEDGLWYEGENYHLFALRGLLTGLGWARLAGVDLLEEDESRARFAAALQVTGLPALPDFTFPGRRGARSLVEYSLFASRSRRRGVRLISARGRASRSRAADAERSLLVDPARDGGGSAGSRAGMASFQHADRVKRPGGAARWGSLRQPRVRNFGRWSWSRRPSPSDTARGRSPLAGRSRHRFLCDLGPVLVSLHAGAQCTAPGWSRPAPDRRPVRSVRDRGSMGLGQRQVRRCDPHPGVGKRIPGGRRRNLRRGESNAGASLAPERSNGTDEFGTVGTGQMGWGIHFRECQPD